MSFSYQSPQRPLPGGFAATPAANKFATAPPSYFQAPRQSYIARLPPLKPHQNAAPTNPVVPGTSTASSGPPAPVPSPAEISPAERAAKTINEALKRDEQYLDLDSYVGQGISSAYDPSESTSTAWAPFQKHMSYRIPDEIFEQYNNAQLTTMMGLFADINHAWVSIDNSVYLWDYTAPSPEILGFEDQPSNVTAVALVTPRPGVFVPSINKFLVVATVTEIWLIAIAAQKAEGTYRLDMYETKMNINVRGLEVSQIVGSADGRVFFAGTEDNDIYELLYQGEERWFYSRCQKINHTSGRFSQWTPNFSFSSNKEPIEHVRQMMIDDSRSLLYTLSSKSNIRVFNLKPNNALKPAVSKTLDEIVRDVGHMINVTPLIGPDTNIISIATVSSQEAYKFHLIAMTSNGCRLYMSGSSSASWASAGGMSIQVNHIRFPPAAPMDTIPGTPAPAPPAQPTQGPNGQVLINTTSTSLSDSEISVRYSPGFFFSLRAADASHHTAFISAPDVGRIAKGLEPEAHSRFVELSTNFLLDGKAEDIGLVCRTPPATGQPLGYANELATQFSTEPTDVAILTNSGVTVFRRQRLIDIFFTAARLNDGSEGREGAAKKFVRLYGRSETAATALSVACGEGSGARFDVSRPQARDTEVQEFGRKVFIEHGGKPTMNENIILDQNATAIDFVRPSPRHDGVALFVTRNVRSFWKSKIIDEKVTPTGGLEAKPTISLDSLKASQDRLIRLRDFLSANKSFIEGLSGPEAARNLATRQDEINLQAEHRALHALEVLTTHIIEGISFVQTLFKERIEEIIIKLENDTRQRVRDLTFEELFSTPKGNDLAKELVKAIVDRNIAKGANVETVADALRRQCGRFCSAEDVVVFRAQEHIRRAHEHGINSEYSRNLLNESMRLYKQVAEYMPLEQLTWAMEQYQAAQFWAGSVQLALDKARELDRGNTAFSWIQDGRPADDPRAAIFELRKKCYILIQDTILSADKAYEGANPDTPEWATINQRRNEVYEDIEHSQDEAFHTDLYDWYLSRNESSKLLAVQSPSVVSYLQRRSGDDVVIADLLWRYHAQHKRFFEAAHVLLDMAESDFALTLDKRIVYLSQAKTYSNQYTPGLSRRKIQDLQKRTDSLLELASLQDEIRVRLKEDERTTSEKRLQWDSELGGKIIELNVLYNHYVESASYFDICLLIYRIAAYDHPIDIRNQWRNLIELRHQMASEGQTKEVQGISVGQPYEAVAVTVRELGRRLNKSEVLFPLSDLIPILKRYQFEQQRGIGSQFWVVDIFLDLDIPAENVYNVLDNMLSNEEVPWQGPNRKHIANDMVYVAQQWFSQTYRGSSGVMGGSDNARSVEASLKLAMQASMDRDLQEEARALIARLGQWLE